MKKLFVAFLTVCALCGCQATKNPALTSTSYVYYDPSKTCAAQKNIDSLDDGIESIEDLQANSDTILIAKVEKINWAEKKNERFRTPIEITCLEVLKGETSSFIYMDGGKMILADYKENAIPDVLAKDYANLFVEGLQRTQHVTIAPLNFIDLEEGKTYLFYLKDKMIINGGYGVFEQISDQQYQNVISGLKTTNNNH